MKQQTLINLGFVLLVGVALIVGRNLWNTYQSSQPNEYQKTVKELDKSTINEIVLSKSESRVALKKENDQWNVATKSADVAKVNELVDALFPQFSPILLAQSDDQRKKLDVTNDLGTKVTLKGGSKEIHFLIGAPTGNTRAVSIADRTDVYGLVNFPSISLNQNDWMSLRIVDIDSVQIKKITVKSENEEYGLEQTENRKWKFTNAIETVNDDGVNTYVMKLNPLKAREIAFNDHQSKYDQIAPAFELRITDQANQEITLIFYKGLQNYLVKRTPKDEAFILENSDAEALNKAKSSFVKVTETK